MGMGMGFQLVRDFNVHQRPLMKRRFQYLFVGIFGLLFLTIFSSGCSNEKSKKPVSAPIPVTVGTVTSKTVPVELRAIGNVQAYSTVTVKSRVAGQIMRVYFKEGDDMKKGDLLFMIDPRPFEAALKQSEANLERDMAQVKQAEANLERDIAQEKNAQVEAERYKTLFERGVVARQQYDKFRTDWEALVATVRAASAAKANAEAAVAADRAAVENAKLQLSYCSIHSPMDGRTGSLIVQSGNIIKENDANLVVINQTTPLYVTFSVPEQNLGEIRKYLAMGKLKVQAIVPNGELFSEEGFISFIDNAVDSQTGTIRLKGTFANREKDLWPGQFVNVVLTLTTEPNAIVVPSQAIQTGQQGQYVFVVKQDLTVESRPVVAGRSVNNETVVPKGLNTDEKVVTDGQLRLYPGAKVEVKNSNSTSAPKQKAP
jgi:multidrug efflux system membrane fusion protein